MAYFYLFFPLQPQVIQMKNMLLIKTVKVLTNTVLFDMSRFLIPLMTGLRVDSNSVSNSNRCRVRATLND